MLTKAHLQKLYTDLLVTYPTGISSTSTKKFDPTREYIAHELGISPSDIYITGSGTRAGNIEVRLSQGQQAKQHTMLGVTYLYDDVGTDENISKLTSSAFTTAEKYVGSSGKSEYDVILVIVISGKDLFVTGIVYLDDSIIASKIISDFPGLEMKPIASKGLPAYHSFHIQKIFFGTPGSGKSYKVKGIVDGHDDFTFRTIFHPDSDYASFVGSYKPVKVGKNLTYEFVPQAFTDAYVKAWNNPDKDVYLVIEEINRGNCAQIFGDLFQLLDRNEQFESVFPINADKDLRKYLETKGVLGVGHDGIKDGKLKLPSNFNILATMNTSDQSLFPMDSAFKRRWAWEYVPIELDNEKSQFIITIGSKQYPWAAFLEKVNECIRKLSESEDKQMGNFFIKSDIDVDEFKSKVMFYIWSEVCKGYEKSQHFFFKDADNGNEEFTFNELFPTNATTNGRLQGFMKFLGVAEKQPASAAAGTTGIAGTAGTTGIAGTAGTTGVAGTAGTTGVAGTVSSVKTP